MDVFQSDIFWKICFGPKEQIARFSSRSGNPINMFRTWWLVTWMILMISILQMIQIQIGHDTDLNLCANDDKAFFWLKTWTAPMTIKKWFKILNDNNKIKTDFQLKTWMTPMTMEIMENPREMTGPEAQCWSSLWLRRWWWWRRCCWFSVKIVPGSIHSMNHHSYPACSFQNSVKSNYFFVCEKLSLNNCLVAYMIPEKPIISSQHAGSKTLCTSSKIILG